ncbi:HAD-IA family hydrolase [Dactylosporangium sp. NPDC049742]|uniref:HAD-IA family hydrolase n=1 Tax=Dactylosporangium sp. NPDC049742 TaxID=3154737 RepID=UPI00343E7BF1
MTRRYPDVFARFDHLFFSHRLRHRKPDPAAFTAVAAHLGAPSDEITFIDDSPANVAAAPRPDGTATSTTTWPFCDTISPKRRSSMAAVQLGDGDAGGA